MDGDDSLAAVKLLSSIVPKVTDLKSISEAIILASKYPSEPTLSDLQETLELFTDACELLLHQLSCYDVDVLLQPLQTATGDNQPQKRFWSSFCPILGLWLKNVEKFITYLRSEQNLRRNWFGKLIAGPKLTNLNEELLGALKVSEGHFEDAQLITALLNLQRQMRVYEVHGGKNLEALDFLCRDLRWKANIIRNRVACLHRETKLHSNWGRTHVNIAEIAMEAVEQAKASYMTSTEF